LNLTCVSVTTVRRWDATPPSFSATVLMTLRPHRLTLLSSMLSTPDARLGQLTVTARSGYKREALYPEPPMRKLHVRPSSASPPLLFILR
jgi:hypothetical protein